MNTTSLHIAILCSRLDLPGGIERAVVNTANLLAEHSHNVTLLILDDTNKSFYPVHPKINIVQESLSFGITAQGNVISRKIRLLSDVLKLRRLIRQIQPTAIIASEYPFVAAAILCGAKKNSKVISWEHHHYHELKRNTFWNKIFKLTYPRLDTVICLNKDEQKLFSTVSTKPVVIPNFIEQAQTTDVSTKTILTIGRLTHVKGTDLLLQVAKEVLQKNPGWQWKLIGDGEMKENVLQFIEKEKLQNILIVQAPVSHQVLEEYQQASLYVMSSRNECFPMTLLEAQSVGLPCVAFDCDSGPRHIINHQSDGILVENGNIDTMIKAISYLINDETTRKKMGEQAFINVKRFAPEKIYSLWKDILD
jgi:amylovoran biosynthesis glycosyltransferase AmsD